MGTDLILSGQRRDGTHFPVDIALSHSDTAEGQLVIAAVRDISVL
jgi:rsbT co-antagonist protein RsbR